jgi:hypothetical protein
MEPQSPLSEWNSEDTQILRQFLETRTGGKLLPRLAESAPTLFEAGDTNKVLIRNGMLIGFQTALREIFVLAYPPPDPKKEVTDYPSLGDDDAWKDGQKLEIPPTQ